MVVIILAVICICILRYVYCCVYNYVHRDDMYFDDESLQMKRWTKKKFIGKPKEFLTLISIKRYEKKKMKSNERLRSGEVGL